MGQKNAKVLWFSSDLTCKTCVRLKLVKHTEKEPQKSVPQKKSSYLIYSSGLLIQIHYVNHYHYFCYSSMLSGLSDC